MRFPSALKTIIAAKGAYVKDCDLRDGHRRAMQAVVRGGALRNRRGVRAGERAAAEAKIEAGIQAALLSWEGISTKIGASALKNKSSKVLIYVFFRSNYS